MNSQGSQGVYSIQGPTLFTHISQALLIWHQSNESCVASQFQSDCWSTAVFFSSPHLLHLYTYTWL